MYLLVSQMGPVYPAAQVHEYWLMPSTQVPPFIHGPLRHSSMSVIAIMMGEIMGATVDYKIGKQGVGINGS